MNLIVLILDQRIEMPKRDSQETLIQKDVIKVLWVLVIQRRANVANFPPAQTYPPSRTFAVPL